MPEEGVKEKSAMVAMYASFLSGEIHNDHDDQWHQEREDKRSAGHMQTLSMLVELPGMMPYVVDNGEIRAAPNIDTGG